MESKLFQKTTLGKLELKNAVVMAPMTRCRALNNIPGDLMAQYYAQRAEAGLIIAEGAAPSPDGLGYSRMPGIYSPAQIEGWKKITSAVHDRGGKIFVQLMHTGRISHPANMPSGSVIVAPSAIAAKGPIWTDKHGMQDMPVPAEMTASDIERTKNDFVRSARNAVEAGFDGIELHGANGYLLNQFLNPASNNRIDEYGNSYQNLCRFVLEVARDVADAIGGDKTGIRLSPYGTTNGMELFFDLEEEYVFLAGKLSDIGLVYIHLVNQVSSEAPASNPVIFQKIRKIFKNQLILCGGYNRERAEKDLNSREADLIAFGKPFISNPDLVSRLIADAPLAEPDKNTFYTADEKGYVDYPAVKK